MAKIAIIGDTHLGVRNDSPVFANYLRRSFSEFFFPYLKANPDIRHCIHLGDLVDRRKYININTAHDVRTDFLGPLNELGIESHIILGNHDVYFRDTNNVNSLDELIGDRYSNIHLHTKVAEIDIDGTQIMLLPWITKDNEKDSYDAIDKTKASLCMSHLELSGFEMYKGMVADHGWNHKIFKKFLNVFTGHFHHKSRIDNICYVGAFGEYVWSDYDDPRGFSVYDTDEQTLTFIRNPFRVFYMIGYNDKDNPDIVDEISDADFSKYNNAYVKVVVGAKTNDYAFDLMLDKLNKESPADVSIVEDVATFTDLNEDERIDEAMGTVQILDQYIEGLTISVEKDKMKTYMRDIYHEALSLEVIE